MSAADRANDYADEIRRAVAAAPPLTEEQIVGIGMVFAKAAEMAAAPEPDLPD